VRSYGEVPRFLKENEYYIDLENRALIVSVTNQRQVQPLCGGNDDKILSIDGFPCG